MDAGTRLRIALGFVAVCFAVLAVLALVNLLLLDPSTGTGTGTGGGDGPRFGPDSGPGQDPGGDEQPTEGGGGEGEDGGNKPSPCPALKAGFGGASIGTLVLSIALWVIAIWWRQAHKTRILNGWAIGALVVSLLSGTLMFLWWVITKICNLDVSDLETCREIARGLRTSFIILLILSVAFLGYAFFLKMQGGKFLNLWSAAGLLLIYLATLSMTGWLVAEAICEREFDEEDLEDLPDPNSGDGGQDGGDGGDGGDPGGSDPGGGEPDPGGGGPGGDPGSNPGRGGNQGGNPGGGGGGGDGGGGSPIAGAPSVSPAWFLTLIGIAALVTVLVMFLRGRGSRAAILAAGIQANALQTERGDLLAMMARTDLASRSAVIAAYRAFLVWCGVRGVPKALHETPLEHGHRVVERLELPWKRLEGLVRAYHVARLAERNPTRHEKDIALAFSKDLESLVPKPDGKHAPAGTATEAKPAGEADA